ncbi:MAG TPA: TetR/AcrR family transcriptional regulator [Burkholderiales bacterium]|jgi:AcrR family transcriptional regulator|nr:TetR/AcrR family transcriptional regulator [Burkholderiales bacterium]
MSANPVVDPISPAAPSTEAERTIADIIAIATAEFAEKGLAGARIDEIAERTRTSKRMIYYYFKSKEGLYLAVLEEAYRSIRAIEATLDLEHLLPKEALRALVGFTFDYQRANPDFIRLVMNENMHKAEYLKKSANMRALNAPAIDSLRDIYRRGLADGVFRKGLDPLDLHTSISALAFFNVSNQHTFSLIFDCDMTGEARVKQRRRNVEDMVLRYVLKDDHLS